MHEVKLPQLGQSVEEASIVMWYKEIGDAVEQGEALFSVQTDKAEIECESTASGVLRKLLVEIDAVVPVLTVVALVGEADEALPELGQYAIADSEATVAVSAAAFDSAGGESKIISTPDRTMATMTHPAASPRASATAARLGVSLTSIPRCRIPEADDLRGSGVLSASTYGGVARAAAAASMPAGELVPLSPMRKTVARRMSDSKFSAPHFYVTVRADMSACKALREASVKFRPTYNDLVLAAVIQALKVHPVVNSGWADEGIVQFGPIHLGFAVALDEGLIVPVIRNADAMTLRELNAATKDLATRAQEGGLNPDDYSGATFTVSNLGPYGVDEFTAIINGPGAAILAVGGMRDEAVVEKESVVVRPMMKMTLSSDHRVIDGAVAAQFAGAVKSALETAAFS